MTVINHPTLATQCQELFDWADGLVADAPNDPAVAHEVMTALTEGATRIRLARENDLFNADLAWAFEAFAPRVRAAVDRYIRLTSRSHQDFDFGLRLISAMP